MYVFIFLAILARRKISGRNKRTYIENARNQKAIPLFKAGLKTKNQMQNNWTLISYLRNHSVIRLTPMEFWEALATHRDRLLIPMLYKLRSAYLDGSAMAA